VGVGFAHLFGKATSVDGDVTWRCSVRDEDVDSAEQWRQTVSGRPDAVRRGQLDAVDHQLNWCTPQDSSDERHHSMICLVDVDLLIQETQLTQRISASIYIIKRTTSGVAML